MQAIVLDGGAVGDVRREGRRYSCRKGKRKRRTWVMSEQSEVSRIKMLRRMGAAEGDATVEGIERACGVPVEECSDRGVT